MKMSFAWSRVTEQEAIFSQPSLRAEVTAACKEVGFRFVTLDLEGYRQGSANPWS